VRYADDFLLLTQRKQDAEQLLAELATRFSQYGLTLHEEKTRLLAFGRYAVGNSAGGPARSGSPTFSFLGFTFYMGKSLAGYLVTKLKTQRERMISKLKVLRREMKARRHMTVAEQQQWLTSVLRGYYAYYGITGNARDIARFRGSGSMPSYPVIRFRRRGLCMTGAGLSQVDSGYSTEEPDAGKSHVRICRGGQGVTLASTRPVAFAITFSINMIRARRRVLPLHFGYYRLIPAVRQGCWAEQCPQP
jgi:hypothetical protein